MIWTRHEFRTSSEPLVPRDPVEFSAWARSWNLAPAFYWHDRYMVHQANEGDPTAGRNAALGDSPLAAREAFDVHVGKMWTFWSSFSMIDLLLVPHLLAQGEPAASPNTSIDVPSSLSGRWTNNAPVNLPERRGSRQISVRLPGDADALTLSPDELPYSGTRSAFPELMGQVSDATEEVVFHEVHTERRFDVDAFESFGNADLKKAIADLKSRGYGPPRHDPRELAIMHHARKCSWIGRIAVRTLTIRRDGAWSLATLQDSAVA
jgi:hypothetical protein